MRSYLAIAISAVLLVIAAGYTGCIGFDRLPTNNANQALSAGIQNYEDGDYRAATKNLKRALDLGLTFDRDIVQAHKDLAFIYCLSKQEKQCRGEFRKALDKDNKFDLKPEEAGHPSWGPIFRSVKIGRKK